MRAFIFLTLITFHLQALACEDQLDLVLENDEKITLCSVDGSLVDKKCSKKKDKCEILKFLKSQKKTPEITAAMKVTAQGRPGSRICNLLKLTVLMGQMPDGSQVCVCKDDNKNYISCNVPQTLFE